MLNDDIKKNQLKKEPKHKPGSTRVNLSQLESWEQDNSIQSKSKQIIKLNYQSTQF